MRPSSIAVLAFVALAAFTAWITRQAKRLEQDLDVSSQKIALLDKSAPEFRLTALDGRTVSLSDYRGKKKLLLVFWASWNNASHPEMLLMGVLYQNGHKPESDFDFLGISLDDDKAAAQKFIGDTKTPFPVVLDQKRAIADSFQIRTIPTVLLVDINGKVEYGSVGFNQRGQMEFAQRLGIRPGDLRMEMRAPNAGRGN